MVNGCTDESRALMKDKHFLKTAMHNNIAAGVCPSKLR